MKFTAYNGVLLLLFAVIVLSIILGLIGIFVIRLTRERKLTEVQEVREKAAMRRRLMLMDDPRKRSLAYVNPLAAADMMDDKG